MTPEERILAGKSQMSRYFQSYYPQWRLAKILFLQKTLNNKYGFFSDIIDEVKRVDDSNGSVTIAQEIRNGIYFDAIAECIQYIEDLFLLMKFSNSPEWFVKNVIVYQAGKITNYVRSYSADDSSVKTDFAFPYFPGDDFCEDSDIRNHYKVAWDRVKQMILDIKDFFLENLFFYNQYKHGLTVALRPFRKFDNTYAEEDKNKQKPVSLYAFDNKSIEKVYRDSSRFSQALLIPDFTNDVVPHLSQLQAEDNLLRLVSRPNPEIEIDEVVLCARKIELLLCTLIHNVQWSMQDSFTEKQVVFPNNDSGENLPGNEKFFVFNYPV